MEESTDIVLPVYVIGDSHALPYRNLIFKERWAAQWVLARAKYISGLTAHDFFRAAEDAFLPELIETLEYEGLLRNGKAAHLSMDEIDFAVFQAAGQPVTPPLMLFTVGDIDVRGVLLPMLGDAHDFVPPFEMPYPVLDLPLIPWDVLSEAIERRIQPFVAGLRRLMASGFTRLYVQSVVPPTLNEARAREVNDLDCAVSVRTKLTAAFNRALAARCKSIGVHVVDLWPLLTSAGYLKPEYELDGVHMPPIIARRHLEQMLEHAINCAWNSTNHVRYELFYRMACGLDPFEAVPASGEQVSQSNG